MTETVVVGSVPYLNAKPLTRWFDTPEGKSSGIQVIEAPPAQLARMLDDDEISVAMVSSFEWFRNPELVYVPGVSISGQDEIKSVRAFAKIPFNMIHTIAMDASSLTSVALLTILLAEVYSVHPQHLSMSPDLRSMLSAADACLLIGDKGMLANSDGLNVIDLGRAWRRLTGQPFVYALWLAKPERLAPSLIAALQTAQEYGQTQFEAIAQEESIRLNCPVEVCLDYVSSVMDYGLDDGLLRGLETFREKVFANNLLGQSRLTGSAPQRILE
jgi:chorismate dehydratase